MNYIQEIKKQLKGVKPERLSGNDIIKSEYPYDAQYLYPMEDYSIIVGVDKCESVDNDVTILYIADENGNPIINIEYSELTEELTKQDYKP